MCMQQHVSTHLPVAVFWVAVQFVCNRCDKTHTHFELWSGTDAGALGLKGSCHVRWRLLEGSELVAGSARVEEKSERWDFLLTSECTVTSVQSPSAASVWAQE